MNHVVNTVRRIAIAAAITLTSASAFATTISVANAGFETPAQSNFSYLGGTTTGGWTFTGYGTGIAANNSAFNVVGASGNQAALLQGAGVSISQVIDFTQGAFSISFLAEGRGQGYGANTISVMIDGVALLINGVTTLTPGTTSSFTQYTTSIVALTAGNHTLSFVGLGAPNGQGDKTTFIDNVSVNVPEPVTLGLFGLGLVALGATRRKAKQA